MSLSNHEELERELRVLLSSVFPVDLISNETSLVGNLDSLGLVAFGKRVVDFINGKTDLVKKAGANNSPRISPLIVFEHPSLTKLAEYLLKISCDTGDENAGVIWTNRPYDYGRWLPARHERESRIRDCSVASDPSDRILDCQERELYVRGADV